MPFERYVIELEFKPVIAMIMLNEDKNIEMHLGPAFNVIKSWAITKIKWCLSELLST